MPRSQANEEQISFCFNSEMNAFLKAWEFFKLYFAVEHHTWNVLDLPVTLNDPYTFSISFKLNTYTHIKFITHFAGTALTGLFEILFCFQIIFVFLMQKHNNNSKTREIEFLSNK